MLKAFQIIPRRIFISGIKEFKVKSMPDEIEPKFDYNNMPFLDTEICISYEGLIAGWNERLIFASLEPLNIWEPYEVDFGRRDWDSEINELEWDTTKARARSKSVERAAERYAHKTECKNVKNQKKHFKKPQRPAPQISKQSKRKMPSHCRNFFSK